MVKGVCDCVTLRQAQGGVAFSPFGTGNNQICYTFRVTFLRTVQHALIILYLCVLVAAFAYTMLRLRTTFMWKIVQFEYMMMAPYQSFAKFNEEFTVLGHQGGDLVEIDLAPYFPVLLGERSIRESNIFGGRSEWWDRRAQYRVFAERILALEERSGRTYDGLTLEWWKWPASPDGYRTLKQREFADVKLLYRTP